MKPVRSSVAALCLIQAFLLSPTHAADAVTSNADQSAAVQVGLIAVADLAQVNGQALACQELAVAARAKTLMLAHSPKTARFGSAFEEGTHNSYLAQTRSESACPDAATLTSRLDVLAKRLQDALPAAPAGAQ